jgi:hypothetical protein
MKEALPQSHSATFKRNVALQLQFCNSNFFLNPKLESFTYAIFGIFLAVESSRFMKQKIEGKKSLATVPLRQVFRFQRNRQV